jgi:hypothetical protein
MSGGHNAGARKCFAENGLVDFYWGMGGPAPQGSFGVYGAGGSTQGRPARINYPAECYLSVHTTKYGGERVIDFSNPLRLHSPGGVRAGEGAADPSHHEERWALRSVCR